MKRIVACMLSCLMIIMLSGCTGQADTPPENIELFESPQPYPDYLTHVIPEPGTTVSLSSSDGWGRESFLDGEDVQPKRKICFTIKMAPLLRSGDDFTYFENLKLLLDGDEVKQNPTHITNLVAVVGNAGGLGSELDLICYDLRGEMTPGIRRLDLVVWTSTGEEFTYSWAIEVVR